MTVLAENFGGVLGRNPNSTQNILSSRNWFKMFGIDTIPVSAEMI
jgi:hypothetical protein